MRRYALYRVPVLVISVFCNLYFVNWSSFLLNTAGLGGEGDLMMTLQTSLLLLLLLPAGAHCCLLTTWGFHTTTRPPALGGRRRLTAPGGILSLCAKNIWRQAAESVVAHHECTLRLTTRALSQHFGAPCSARQQPFLSLRQYNLSSASRSPLDGPAPGEQPVGQLWSSHLV